MRNCDLEQRIVREIDTRRNVLGHEGDLFGFREEIIGHAIRAPVDLLESGTKFLPG